jgi:hypothetical protein
MLVSTIIANALSKADISAQSFYTPNDQIFDAQLAWEEIYTLLAESDDDYFITSLYLVPGTDFTTDTNRTSLFIYPLPADFFRLRMLSHQAVSGGHFVPCTKMNTNNFGYSQQAPAYRLVGNKLELYDPYNFNLYNLWYYPAPAQLVPATDITYPTNIYLEYMVWKMAADIRRKQNQDASIQQLRANEIMQNMKRQINRDNFRVQAPKDIFSQGNDYWS